MLVMLLMVMLGHVVLVLVLLPSLLVALAFLMHIAGAYSEDLPVICVGGPNSKGKLLFSPSILA